MDLTVNDVIENFKKIISDDEISNMPILNELGNPLPYYLKDTINYLEDLMMTNNTFFKHILARLTANGFSYSVNNKIEFEYHIVTSKGTIVLI